ncbi:MAG: hypothetical protein EA357_06505 [Micavibrio sp.]|nr:MAG: hypothetical protein EA357_06505 [Micavibrio sp.]
MRKLIFLCVLVLAAAAYSGDALASATQPRLLSKHHDWGVYVYEERGHKVCFMASAPSRSEGNYTRRGDVFAFITHWTEDGSKNVFNIMTGYPYRTGSTVNVDIDGKKFTLPITKGEMAWAADKETDDGLADAIQRGNRMVVRGTSQRGTLTTDTFSLRGSTAAYRASLQACNM